MSDFWSRRLAGGQEQPRPAAPVIEEQRPSGTAWWRTDVPATQQPAAPMPVQQEHTVTVPLKAASARMSGTCPDCGSGNYFRPHGQPNAMEQCYDCGYNARFLHSTHGTGLPAESGVPVHAARQVASGGLGGKSNYQPGNYIARNVGSA